MNIDSPTRKGWLIFAGTLAATFALGMLVASILERRQEAKAPLGIVNPVADLEPDSAKWGVNFPREYESWLQTASMKGSTRYGGPGPIDHLRNDPRLKTLFAGYPFSIEYNDDRGHMHALEDVRATARRDPARGGVPSPGTCMTCKSSDVPRLMREMGVAEFYKTPFTEIDGKVGHPIGCADCHDPKTMNLRISRPALREAFAAMGRDIDKASHQEMRTLVCAQCHVEYYFAKKSPWEQKGTYLTFPWARGLNIDDIEAYYTADVPHVDWVHPVSGTKIVKMQHPDYELFTTGVHAFQGLACADCHMPYVSEGGVKYSNHHIRSPLNDTESSCQVCHRWTREEFLSRVYSIQDKHKQLLDLAEEALVKAHEAVGAAMKNGAGDDRLASARELIRRAQMRWDFIAAGNGMGFHSPQESARILATAIDLAQEARILAAELK